jgi:hypothetical protein
MKRFTFEIQEVYDPDTDEQYRVLSVEGELFDWGLDEGHLKGAKEFCGDDEFLKRTVKGDICKFFISCLSESLGLKEMLTLGQINEALEQGYLEISAKQNGLK